MAPPTRRPTEAIEAPDIAAALDEPPAEDVQVTLVEPLSRNGSFAVIIGVLGLLAVIVVLSPFYLTFSTIVAIGIGAVTFVLARHFYLIKSRAASIDQAWTAASTGAVPDTSRLPAMYFTYVLGSGGHTGELCEMIKQQFKASSTLHRRYIITSGDNHSRNAVARLEGLIQRTFPAGAAGTWDAFRVVRARRVHQPLWTAWYTSLLSALSIVQALIQEPEERSGVAYGRAFEYPHVIVTNGPGTGFIVCLVAHLLKIFGLVPRNRLKVVYIETWAHLTTLSLTGLLFHYTNIADLFMVQHQRLAGLTGKRFIGQVAKDGNLLGIKGIRGL